MAEQWTADLATIKPARFEVSNAPDHLSKMEMDQLQREAVAEGLRDSASRRRQREIWARRVFWLALGWLVVSLLAVLACGAIPQWFHLSDAVLIALVSGGTINIIGVLAIIVRSLFPSPEK